MSAISSDVSKDLSARLAEADKNLQNTFKKLLASNNASVQPRYTLTSTGNELYLQDTRNLSAKAPISKDLYELIKATGVTGIASSAPKR